MPEAEGRYTYVSLLSAFFFCPEYTGKV